MKHSLYLGTTAGLFIARREGDAWQVVRQGLVGQRVTSVIACEGAVLAGTRDGVYRSDDDGRTWRDASAGLTTRYVRWLAHHSDGDGAELAGTEPANIFLSRDGGKTWRECPEVARLRDAHGWYLPYSSGAGCVRGFASHGARAYAAVEVGGVLRSDDDGGTWRLAEGSDGNPRVSGLVEPLVHPDVHSIVVHPSSPDLVLAPTGGGLYLSTDGGGTWQCLYRCYCRAAWVDPADPQHLIFGPADSVDREGRIEETRDGGGTWHTASSGLDVPWERHMVERFAQVGDDLLAVLSNGELLSAPLVRLEWERILTEVEGVRCVMGSYAG
jgi:hypothetical protein